MEKFAKMLVTGFDVVPKPFRSKPVSMDPYPSPLTSPPTYLAESRLLEMPSA